MAQDYFELMKGITKQAGDKILADAGGEILRKSGADPMRILPAQEDPEEDEQQEEAEQIAGMPLVGALSAHKFVAVHERVMNGSQFICHARSKTMAKRIANALNNHVPNREGV